MKVSFKFGDKVICLPAKAVSEHLTDATKEELSVLLALAVDPSADEDSICSELGIDHDEFIRAVSFWRGSGAVSVSLGDGEKLPSARKKSEKQKKDLIQETPAEKTQSDSTSKKSAVPVPSSAPVYSTAQLADFIEGDPSLRVFIENCQQIMGKIFSSAEAASLIGTVQYLGVSTDYIALLCAFAISHGKRSVRYVEKMAIGLYDEGITKYSELELHLKKLNKAEEMIPEIRKMFGLGDRALTAKEKKAVNQWCGEFEFDLEIIRKAYEITVTNTGKAALPYCNSILENWYNAGYKTAAQIDSATEEYKNKKAAAGSGSFDTDDFFEAALKRSYEITGGI